MKVHAIQTGLVRIKRRQVEPVASGLRRRVDTLRDRQWSDWLPIHAWVIEHPGGTIVVDTGETARVNDPGYLLRWHPYWRRHLPPRPAHGRIDGVAPDDAQARESVARVRAFVQATGAVCLPTHDPGSAGRLAAATGGA